MYGTDVDSAVAAEYLKNDFQTAIRHNLHSWVKWRTNLNDNLVSSVQFNSLQSSVQFTKV